MLKVEGLTMRFGGLKALSDVDLEVAGKEIRAIVGPNGSGKTTFFNVLTGVYRPVAGRVLLEGRDITGFQPYEITRAGVARTFQNIRLFKDMSILENVQVGLHNRLRGKVLDTLLATSRKLAEDQWARNQAEELLDFVGIRGDYHQPAHSLAYGKQRLLEMARALATNPRLLMLDEPTAGMNDSERDELSAVIKKLRGSGLTIILIEHHMKFVMSLADLVTVFDSGAKIAEGVPEEIQSNPVVVEAYLGREDGEIA